jgi:N-methylhydantoinase A
MGRPNIMTLRIGIDVGGTFTDGLAFDTATGAVFTAKVPSTPDPANGFFAALDAILQQSRQAPSFLAHGTTVATNALIQGRHARVALVTNRGFRDILEIAFQSRPDLYDARIHRAPPLVPRELCHEVSGRIGPGGVEEDALDPAELDRLAVQLRAVEPPVEAIVVCLLHSYRNDAHEVRVADTLARALGQHTLVTPSVAVCREFREYSRASTAVVNAAVAPLMDRYLTAVEGGLRHREVDCGLYVMQSNGGLVAAAAARRRPAFVIESGPAAAAIAGAHVASTLGIARALCLDIGGTTAKVALILDGQAAIAPELEVGPLAVAPNRLSRAGGYLVRTPCVDLVEIGAGGGSIAWLDAGGALRVGPRSAGAVPGPACYPEGGEEPTLTDANVVLGRIDPEYFLGGRVRLREHAAEAAIARLGAAMGKTKAGTAWGVVAIAVDAMGAALRLASVDKGYDPRQFALVALGGAGPLHACEIAAAAGIRRVIVLPRPGLGSALGLLVTDLKVEAVVSWIERLGQADLDSIGRRMKALSGELREELANQGVTDPTHVDVRCSLDLRYFGQSFELRVPWDLNCTAASLTESFHESHRHLYGFAATEEPVELVALRATGSARVSQPQRGTLASASLPARPARVRQLIAENPERAVTGGVYHREDLLAGHEVNGPSLIIDRDATTYVPPQWGVRVEPTGYLVAERS